MIKHRDAVKSRLMKLTVTEDVKVIIEFTIEMELCGGF